MGLLDSTKQVSAIATDVAEIKTQGIEGTQQTITLDTTGNKLTISNDTFKRGLILFFSTSAESSALRVRNFYDAPTSEYLKLINMSTGEVVDEMSKPGIFAVDVTGIKSINLRVNKSGTPGGTATINYVLTEEPPVIPQGIRPIQPVFKGSTAIVSGTTDYSIRGMGAGDVEMKSFKYFFVVVALKNNGTPTAFSAVVSVAPLASLSVDGMWLYPEQILAINNEKSGRSSWKEINFDIIDITVSISSELIPDSILYINVYGVR